MRSEAFHIETDRLENRTQTVFFPTVHNVSFHYAEVEWNGTGAIGESCFLKKLLASHHYRRCRQYVTDGSVLR